MDNDGYCLLHEFNRLNQLYSLRSSNILRHGPAGVHDHDLYSDRPTLRLFPAAARHGALR